MNQDYFQTDLTTWEIGPYHSALPGPMRLKLKLDGEIISSAQVETGFLHKGLEKAHELHPWQSLISYVDHLDPEAGVFGELVLSMAVEEIFNLEVPPRAQMIRLILCELSRISSHLLYVVRMARSVGSETIVHYVLRDREKILDLFELLTGARFSLNFLRYGGVRFDITEGFVERVLDTCDLIRIRIKEYNDLFTYNHSFIKRTAGISPLSKESIHLLGVTGPNARASGMSLDYRKTTYYLGYKDIEFETPLGTGAVGCLGDVHDRFIVRLKEISQSMEILKQLINKVPSGEFYIPSQNKMDQSVFGESYKKIESPRGLLGCYVSSEGREQPSRVQFRTPSMSHLSLIPLLIVGIKLEDLPVVIASLDLSLAEADK